MYIPIPLHTLAVTSLLALTIVASPALTGDARAAGTQASKAPASNVPSTAARAKSPGTSPQVPTMTIIQKASAQVFPDEGGPASEGLCNWYGREINDAIREGVKALDRGDVAGAIAWGEYGDAIVDMAVTDGCIVLW